jgi:hypothetical protein
VFYEKITWHGITTHVSFLLITIRHVSLLFITIRLIIVLSTLNTSFSFLFSFVLSRYISCFLKGISHSFIGSGMSQLSGNMEPAVVYQSLEAREETSYKSSH